MSSKNEQAFEKRTKNVFVPILPIQLKSIFLHFLFNFKKKLVHILNIYLIYVKNTIFKNINDFHKIN